MKLNELLNETKASVRHPTDEEHKRAREAIKKENPRLSLDGIGVNKETDVIHIGTGTDNWELHPDGRLVMTSKV